MNRRSLLKLGGMALAHAGASRSVFGKQAPATFPPASQVPENKADYTLRIAPVTVELDRSHILSTIGYNGTLPDRCCACVKAKESPLKLSTTRTHPN